jgi:clan AA aspartic protease
MGFVYAEITLKNSYDVISADRGIIKEPEIRQTAVTALVDTGAATLVINEAIRQQLGLKIKRSREMELADGSKQIFLITDPVEIHWKNRDMISQAVVVPNTSEVLLGAIPLEAMDLIIDPARQELIGAHGDDILTKIK